MHMDEVLTMYHDLFISHVRFFQTVVKRDFMYSFNSNLLPVVYSISAIQPI